ncbi:hypothetical protein ACA910_006968 [Epithemia clementina (nom. ined.)]
MLLQLPPKERLQTARSLWLNAKTRQDLEQVESLYWSIYNNNHNYSSQKVIANPPDFSNAPNITTRLCDEHHQQQPKQDMHLPPKEELLYPTKKKPKVQSEIQDENKVVVESGDGTNTKDTTNFDVSEHGERKDEKERELLVKGNQCSKEDHNSNGLSAPNDNDEDEDEDHENNNNNYDALRIVAGERLALLLLQSGRAEEADAILADLNFTCRLASHVLNYSSIAPAPPQPPQFQQNAPTTAVPSLATTDSPPCCCRVMDHFLTSTELSILQSVFANRQSSYWTDHEYQVEPEPSPYVSYVIPLRGCRRRSSGDDDADSQIDDNRDGNDEPEDAFHFLIQEFGFLGCLIQRILQQLSDSSSSSSSSSWKKPNLMQQCTHVEMWAHNRPMITGHQLHFDSDNEGNSNSNNCDGPESSLSSPSSSGKTPTKKCVVRHPLVSTVLYLSPSLAANGSGGGGPTLITNQRRMHRHLADQGWLCLPALGRMVAFDGRVLHGVIPGKVLVGEEEGSSLLSSAAKTCSSSSPTPLHSTSNQGNYNNKNTTNNIDKSNNRVTLMLAFWRRLQVRDHGTSKVGAAKPFPTNTEWAKVLRQPFQALPPSLAFESEDANDSSSHGDKQVTSIIPLDHVYESIQAPPQTSGMPWNRSMGMPTYDEIYQGF